MQFKYTGTAAYPLPGNQTVSVFRGMDAVPGPIGGLPDQAGPVEFFLQRNKNGAVISGNAPCFSLILADTGLPGGISGI